MASTTHMTFQDSTRETGKLGPEKNPQAQIASPQSIDPHNWKPRKKWVVTVFLSFLPFIYTQGSSGISVGVDNIMRCFDVSRTVALLPLSLYVLAMGLGSLIWAPLSEVYGRQNIYRFSWLTYCLFHIGSALAQNIQTLLICRFLAGIMGACVMSTGAGVLNDLWTGPEVGIPVSIFITCGFLGPCFGPIFDGYLVQDSPESPKDAWRWTQWLLLILSGTTALGVAALPETHLPTIKRRYSRKQVVLGSTHPQQTGITYDLVRTALFRPIVILFLDPIVLVMSLYMSVIFGIFYLYFAAYQIVFPIAYGWKQGPGGLAFLAIMVGVAFGVATSHYGNILYFKLKAKRIDQTEKIYPEGRLPLSLLASVTGPASVLWFGWSSRPDVHWIVPVLSGVLFGWSVLTIFVCTFGYINEAYYQIAASVVGSATLLRALFAFGFPLFAPSVIARLQIKWTGTLLGCLLVLFMPVPWLFYRYGRWLRSKSRYSSTRKSQAS